MNQQEFESKLAELLSETEFMGRLQRRCLELYASGGIDPEKYIAEDFALPKVVLSAALPDAVDWYYPHRSPDMQEDVENLRHF